MKRILILPALLFIISSCRKDDNNTASNNGNDIVSLGKVKMEYFNVVGTSNLSLNNQWYRNANGDSFAVSKFNYYISNVQLMNGASLAYTEPNSYHLLQQSDLTSMNWDMTVPVGKYTGVIFTLGVDSAHNVSGAQSGALDPSNGMFWSWNTGYIMLKFEGNSPKAPTTNGFLQMHCGGYSGSYSSIRTVSLPFVDSAITVTSSREPHVHVNADIQKLLSSPTVVDFSQMYSFMTPNKQSAILASNAAQMYSISYAGY